MDIQQMHKIKQPKKESHNTERLMTFSCLRHAKCGNTITIDLDNQTDQYPNSIEDSDWVWCNSINKFRIYEEVEKPVCPNCQEKIAIELAKPWPVDGGHVGFSENIFK